MSERKACRFFLQGRCTFGARCKYSHERIPDQDHRALGPRQTNHQHRPQATAAQQEWSLLLRQASIPRQRQSKACADHFFRVALSLMEGDIECVRATIRQFSDEDGLAIIRDLADRCAATLASGTGWTIAELWVNQLSPFFKTISHHRVVDSAILEGQVATLYNFLVGPGALRLVTVFNVVVALIKNWPGAPPGSDPESRMAAIELSLDVLAKAIDCNTSNMLMESFSAAADQFSTFLQEPFGTNEEFHKLQAEKHLEYIRRRLGVGQSIETARPATLQPVTRAEFVLERDLPGTLSAAGPRHDNDHVNIEHMQILPTYGEIASSRTEYLPTNDVSRFHIPSIRGRIDREFRLLREDTVGQLRDAVRAQIERMQQPDSNPVKTTATTVRTYSYRHPRAGLVELKTPSGLEFTCTFPQPVPKLTLPERQQWWARSKRLLPGALVCLVSATGSALFFVVAQLTSKYSEQKHASSLGADADFCSLRLVPVDADTEGLEEMLRWYRDPDTSVRRCLVEFPGVLLPSFFHTLKSLQNMSEKPRLPFTGLIAHAPNGGEVVEVNPPQYAMRAGFSFDLGAITHGNSSFLYSVRDIPDPERLSENSSLDLTQATALLNTLRRQLSLIQGPPGTGKSYTGEKIIRVLLSNKQKADLGPILCVCYTNHALDQLLEHLVDAGVEQIIRIGSRSKSERLDKLNLREVVKDMQRMPSEKRSLWTSHNALADDEKRVNTSLVALENSKSLTSLKEFLHAQYPRHYQELFGQGPDDEGWETVRYGAQRGLQSWLRSGAVASSRPRSLDDLRAANMQTLARDERQRLYECWLEEISQGIIADIETGYTSHKRNCKGRDAIRNEIDLRCLHGANVIGVTTTGLARNLNLLSRLQCKVLLCEEAGEVLEAHLLTTLLPSVEHAILIGDHQQLRPQIQNYELQSTNPRGAQYSHDVSLFERLVEPPYETDARLPLSTLDTQRRMHPSISELVRSTLYHSLEDDQSVRDYPPVVGMKKRLFWLDHEELEASAMSSDPLGTSHSNDFEIEMATLLVSHLVRQGSYGRGDIAVLTPYLGQLHRLRQRMSSLFEITVNERDQADLDTAEQHGETAGFASFSANQARKSKLLDSIRVATVDNFQGEEAKIIVISLVRSNPQNKCGFLSTSNRINVLLSRAQHGMFIIGNSNTYANVPMWAQILRILRRDGNIGPQLELQCPRHPGIPITVSNPDHFVQFAPEGGCNLACDRRLECGHTCTSRCHSEVIHNAVKCLEPCPRPYKECEHPCPLACGDECPPKCTKQLTSLDLELPCGHRVSKALCWEAQNPPAIRCSKVVNKSIPGCEHSVQLPCHIDVDDPMYQCQATCDNPQPCGHSCKSICFRCNLRQDDGAVTSVHAACRQPCGRKYTTCRHTCAKACHGESKCPPCPAPCEVRCSHSVCSKPCHEPCSPCASQDCASQCPHGKCSMPCAAPCDWVPCSKRCEEKLPCGHQCPSVCGEVCPSVKYCRECCSDVRSKEVDFIMGMEYHEIDLEEDPCIFPDCGHFLTTTNMDGLMDLKGYFDLSGEGVPMKISGSSKPFSMDEVKVCPTCRGSLRNIARYGRIVRRAILDETTKKFISWSTAEISRLTGCLFDEQDRLGNLPPCAVTVQHEQRRKQPTAAPKQRWAQLHQVTRLVSDGRYDSIYRLRHEISKTGWKVSREEQPLQRVANFVRHAQHQRRTVGAFEFDDAVIQVKGQLQVTALLLKCELAILLDFMKLYEKAEGKGPVELDMSEFLKDSEGLVAQAQATHHPRQEIEGHVYFTYFCGIAKTLLQQAEAGPSLAVDKLKADGTMHVEAARAIVAKTPSTAVLEPEITAVEKFLNGGMFYAGVSLDEMRAVYRAMSAELLGTGHWYTCENNHPFTVGECGMPMERARCPECGAPVGGQSHQPAEGVRHATEVEELARDLGGLHMA
ncbi:hypothetical protein F4780DRAFT_730730 [Xylariomycetidae sp. FL0641]|nr:hypothetical protein F4780DRAFT_730730 [Xylariomycetidae sp. FL0641]